MCKWFTLTRSHVRSYSENISQFLWNRPAFFIKHYLQWLLPKVIDICQSDIAVVESGVWIVCSSSPRYVVLLRSERDNISLCKWVDWSLYMLPCKHLLDVLTLVDRSADWESLPTFYRKIKRTVRHSASPPESCAQKIQKLRENCSRSCAKKSEKLRAIMHIFRCRILVKTLSK